MRFNDVLMELSKKFISAWNSGDMETLQFTIHEQIEYHSPLIRSLWVDNVENVIKGKNEFLRYLKDATLRKIQILVDIDTIAFNKTDDLLHVKATLMNTDVKLDAFYKLNEYGKLTYLSVQYSDYTVYE